MEICIGADRFTDLRTSAYWCKYDLDKRPGFYDEELAAEGYTKFLEYKLQHPTTADLAMKDTIKKNPIKNSHFYNKNRKALEKVPEVDYLLSQVNGKINQLYPKSYPIRKTLIEQNRLSLDCEISPKLSGLKKVMLKLRTLF